MVGSIRVLTNKRFNKDSTNLQRFSEFGQRALHVPIFNKSGFHKGFRASKL